MEWKDYEGGYTAIRDEIRDTIKSYNAVQNSSVIDVLTHGRAKVRHDATNFSMKFSDHFNVKRNAWSIISDYANLFAHMYKKKHQVGAIPNSSGAPINMEFIIYVYGELG